MLPHEIQPFAQAQIEALETVRQALIKVRASDKSDLVILDEEELDRCMDVVRGAQRGFYRFQVCMIDEQKMKDRLRVKVRDCRLHHKD